MSLLGVETVVRDRLGMDPNSLGPSALPQAVELRMKARGIKAEEEYCRLLSSDSGEADSLGVELAVPESWFFRGGRALFTRMAEFVAARAATRAPGQVVRVLSIPCSTGEEPYSLAIAFHEHFISPKEYRIDAFDVSSRHLERAEKARFPAFSFRETGSDIRPAYFRHADDRWELLPHLRQLVRFRLANLTDPAFLVDEQPYDLIVCRNVFIYLTPDGRRRAMTSLDRLLAFDGLMCLTAGEADRLPAGQFTQASAGEFGLYRRVLAVDVVPAVWVPQPETKSTRQFANEYEAPQQQAIPVLAKYAEPVAPPTPQISPIESARELANRGRLIEARAACDGLLRDMGPSAELYTLIGTVDLAEGLSENAAEAFRRALYLDPHHQEAISHMILICDQKGNEMQSAAFRRRLARLSQGGAA
ncbi:MAG: hypothetical protein C0467_00505 [Planctomycetaceae bacterium]|nr:hypothetical protein [Planctomycetaceae bacterium]